MLNIDLYLTLFCWDCKKTFFVVGSTPATKTECTHCKGKNWDNYIPPNYKFKRSKK